MQIFGRAVAFIRALATSGRRSQRVRLIVLHSMEAPERPTMAEDLGGYWSRNRVASSHFGVDNNSIVQYVDIGEVAWHAGGVNAFSVGIEQAGTASQSAVEWDDEFSRAMINDQTVPLLAWLCAELGIPARFVDAAGILRGDAGITTHAEVSKVYKESAGHWDPGPNYPLTRVIQKVATKTYGRDPRQAPPKPPVQDLGAVLRALTYLVAQIKASPVRLKRPYEKSQRVELIQKLLRAKGYTAVVVDSVFGPNTEWAVEHFQHRAGLVADGVVGPKTIDALVKR